MKKYLISLCIVFNIIFTSPFMYGGAIVHADDASPSPTVTPNTSLDTPPPIPVAPTPPPKPTEPPVPVLNFTPPPSPTPPKAPQKPTEQQYLDALNAGTVNGQQTGGQNGSYANGNGSVTTGDANAAGTFVTNANTNLIGNGNGSGQGGSESAANSGNGAYSNNSGSVSDTASSSASLSNTASLDNGMIEVGSSGNNSSSYNTGNGSVTTGNANVSGTVLNGLNTNAFGSAEFTVTGDHVGDIVLEAPNTSGNCTATCVPGNLSASNTNNGTESQNTATASADTSSNNTLSNQADLTNNITLTGVTGGNSADYNNGTGSVKTGDVNAAADVLNAVNSNITNGGVYVINIVGDLVGDIVLPGLGNSAGSSCTSCANQNTSATNSGNGTLSSNNTNTNSNSSDTTSMANSADVSNNINVNGNTGDNTSGLNTNGANGVTTGNVNLSSNVVNVTNTNVDNNSNAPVWIVLVNKMGQWVGQILDGPPGQTTGGSDGIQFSQNPDGTITATNNGNGAASSNTANASSSNTNTTAMTNDAHITNNVTINGDTGHNDASYNVGGSSISTGNVNAAVNIINFINNNFAGRPVYVAVINVFGSWIGNVVDPAHQHTKSSSGNSQSTSAPTTTNAPISSPAANTANPTANMQNVQTVNSNNATGYTNDRGLAGTLPSSTGTDQSGSGNAGNNGLVAGAHITIVKSPMDDTLHMLWPFIALALVLPVSVTIYTRRVISRRKQ